jgi:hypothetical protein
MKVLCTLRYSLVFFQVPVCVDVSVGNRDRTPLSRFWRPDPPPTTSPSVSFCQSKPLQPASPLRSPFFIFFVHVLQQALFSQKAIHFPDSIVAINHATPEIKIKMAKTTTLKEFESVFPKLVEDLLDHAKQYKLPEEFVKWYKAVSPYATLPTAVN